MTTSDQVVVVSNFKKHVLLMFPFRWVYNYKQSCFVIVYHFMIFLHIFVWRSVTNVIYGCKQFLKITGCQSPTGFHKYFVGWQIPCNICNSEKYSNHHHYLIKGTLFTFRNNPIWTIFVAFKMLKRKTLHFDLPRHLCLGGWGVGEIHIPRWCLFGSSRSNPENGWCLSWFFPQRKLTLLGKTGQE